MTREQVDCFNKKINILYDYTLGYSTEQIARKYNLSRRMVNIHIKLAKNNFRIIEAVKARIEIKNKKEMREYT